MRRFSALSKTLSTECLIDWDFDKVRDKVSDKVGSSTSLGSDSSYRYNQTRISERSWSVFTGLAM
jgi:hypothetical protein